MIKIDDCGKSRITGEPMIDRLVKTHMADNCQEKKAPYNHCFFGVFVGFLQSISRSRIIMIYAGIDG